MNNQDAWELAAENARLAAQYSDAREKCAIAARAFRDHTEKLRRALYDLSDSLSRDATEATIRTVVAIHNGRDDEAYAFACGSARAARAAAEGLTTALDGGGDISPFDARGPVLTAIGPEITAIGDVQAASSPEQPGLTGNV